MGCCTIGIKSQTMPSLSMSRNLGIDALKALSAFLVVVIHSHFNIIHINADLANGLNAFARLGVGSFFIISGYYFPLLVSKGKLKGHLVKIMKIAVWSLLLYLLFNMVYNQFVWHDYLIPIKRCIGVDKLLSFAFFNHVHIEIHIWYLFAIAYTMFFCYLFYRYNKKKALYITATFIFVVGVLVGYLGKYDYQRTWLFYGIPFVAAGIFIRERLDVSTIVLTLSIGMLITVAEAVYLGVNRDYYILSIVLASLALILAIKVGPLIGGMNNGLMSSLCIIGAKYSLYIYIFHIAVKRSLDAVFDTSVLHVGYPVLIFLLSLGVSVVWVKIPHRPF